MKKHLIFAAALLAVINFDKAENLNSNSFNMISKSNFIFATYISDNDQVRNAFILINSIRDNGGEYSNCDIYVGVPDLKGLDFEVLKTQGVKFINLDIPDEAKKYYYAVKAYAAAQIEKSLDKNINTLAWFDPETIVLGPVNELELKEGYSAAIRPVFLMNNIGLTPDEQPNDYWAPLYDYLKLNVENIPVVETEVDMVKTRAYYNCGIFSVNPSHGLMQQWAKVQTVFLKDNSYQKSACSDVMRKIFFHQVVFSCVVSSMLKPEHISSLPITCGYPLELHQRLPDYKKQNVLNNVSCAIVEDLWDKNNNWLDEFSVEEPLKLWLQHATQEYLSLGK